MLPAFVTEPDGSMRELATICVDSSEFVVSKLKDRGTHQAFGVVTNAQDFMHILRFYVERELASRGTDRRPPAGGIGTRRMTRIISATRERFLLAIAAHVPPARIAEIHFFHGIKQGGMESGVAVVAATLAGHAPPPSDQVAGLAIPEAADDGEPSPYADDVGASPVPVATSARFTVLTAHYRLTLKGPDRGKWEAAVVEEADAPLITVETVVRGVQRRSGDVEDPERMDGREIREILDAITARA